MIGTAIGSGRGQRTPRIIAIRAIVGRLTICERNGICRVCRQRDRRLGSVMLEHTVQPDHFYIRLLEGLTDALSLGKP